MELELAGIVFGLMGLVVGQGQCVLDTYRDCEGATHVRAHTHGCTRSEVSVNVYGKVARERDRQTCIHTQTHPCMYKVTYTTHMHAEG